MSDIIAALDVLIDNGASKSTIVEVAHDLLDSDSFNDSDDSKIVALIIHTDGSTDIEPAKYDSSCSFEADGADYLVLDEDELEQRWDDYLESYLDDGCVEGADGAYFDRERWKIDARMDGAGHALSSYDGSEDEVGKYFIYRTN